MNRLPPFKPDDIDYFTHPWLLTEEQQAEARQGLRANILRRDVLREIRTIADRQRQGKLLAKLYRSDIIMIASDRLLALELLQAEVRKDI